MKNRILFLKVLIIAAVIATFVCCNDDENKTGADEVSDTVQDGTWKVGYFYDSGLDKTQNYAGYNFTFGGYTALTATKETNTYTGVWSASKSTSDDNINGTIFMIGFGSPEALIRLSRSWKVIENTGTSLKLKDDSHGESAIDQLYLEKN